MGVGDKVIRRCIYESFDEGIFRDFVGNRKNIIE